METEFDLLHFAEMLTTVEQWLGLNTDNYIIFFFVCNVCRDRHKPDTLYKVRSPICSQDSCMGMLYAMKRPANGKEKRTPTKILPYVRFIQAIHWILAHPRKWEDVQNWCQSGDESVFYSYLYNVYIFLINILTFVLLMEISLVY